MSISNTYVDGDSLVFKCSYGTPTKLKMKERWKRSIEKIRSDTFADNLQVALRGEKYAGNFREELSPIYKKNRPKLSDEVMKRLMWLNDWAVEDQGAVPANGWEADDLVCAWSYQADKRGEAYVIAGIDKDLLQYPGNHYNYGGSAKNPKKQDERWTFVTPEEGQFTLLCQILTGDTSDNIIGIKGIGPAKAKKALLDKTPKEMMEKIIEMYKKHWGRNWEEQLVMNSNLIYMRRFEEDTFEYKEYLR